MRLTATELLMSDKTQSNWHPGPEEQAIVDALAKHQETLELSDEAFARDYLSYTVTVWGRVKKGEYWDMVADGSGVVDMLANDLSRLQRDLVLRGRFDGQMFARHKAFDALLKAVDACLRKPLANPDRLIVTLAPTGGGKSASCGQLVKLRKAVMVEARRAWQRSYFSALKDLSKAVGVKGVDECYAAARLEEKLLETLMSRRFVVAIDEGEFFSPDTLNLLKLCLNESPVVIVLAVIPEAYQAWNDSAKHEAWQIRRRTHAVVELEAISPEVAEQFFRHARPDGEAVAAACKLANAFGHFDTLDRLAREFPNGEVIDLEAMRKAGDRVRKFQRLPTKGFWM